MRGRRAELMERQLELVVFADFLPRVKINPGTMVSIWEKWVIKDLTPRKVALLLIFVLEPQKLCQSGSQLRPLCPRFQKGGGGIPSPLPPLHTCREGGGGVGCW